MEGEAQDTPCRESISPYYVNAGQVLAPATSANDTEQQSTSSDADSFSLTDSSLDGFPPYRCRKRHRRDMQESARANGLVPLPHFPRKNRIPKDIHVEPEHLAAELIRRLEDVLRQREAEEKLEEQLRRVQLEEGDAPSSPSGFSSLGQRLPPGGSSVNYYPRYADITYGAHFDRDEHEENPESILDEHVQRVMKTPGCGSPGACCHSPKSPCSDAFPAVRETGQPGQSKHPPRHGFRGESSHLHHHKYHGHLTGGKSREQIESEAASRVQCGFPWSPEMGHYGSKSRSYADGWESNLLEQTGYSRSGTQCKRALKRGEEMKLCEVPGAAEDSEKKQKSLMWRMEGPKETAQHKKAPRSHSGFKRTTSLNPADRSCSMHPCLSNQVRTTVQPFHPFIQDPTMPPNPAPSPLTQLEEVRRRLEEEKMKPGFSQPKQRYVMEVIQRGRAAVRPAPVPLLNVVPAVSDSELSEPEHKAGKKPPCESVTVAYYFCEELIPYRTSVKGRAVTFAQFKELLTKKGNYRYYFKKVSDEFDCGVVFEEVCDDDAILPVFGEKIVGKVEKVD